MSAEENKLILQDHIIPRGGCTTTWILGGTEMGFNIPLPPTAVSVSLISNRVSLRWVNPPANYDSIAILYYGGLLATLPGDATEYSRQHGGPDDAGYSSEDITILVMGCKGGLPSNGTGVRLRRQVEQESLMNVPFTHGLAPGFQQWTENGLAGRLIVEQGNLPGMSPSTDVRQFHGKGFYQIIRGTGAFQGGVSRRFLGLLPGHTYRIGARLNTLETKGGDWSFSFHAAYNPASGNDLTVAQVAGNKALPSGAAGKAAGQIAKYGSTVTTEGQWSERSSNRKSADNPTGDITLPPKGSDSITAWFRLEGKDADSVAVGLDSVTIEDLGEKPRTVTGQ